MPSSYQGTTLPRNSPDIDGRGNNSTLKICYERSYSHLLAPGVTTLLQQYSLLGGQN
ncbi:hypothetical protein ACJ72_03618 [Emergomyces africanus]|uniref:Uncharacterized protein n=1 Tax=Emergomyces africanus TaxID=1955775 RepID=A0A1B7NZ67_9EURO|nr:hypothetical protein ACJ72_03618 [Emergomyces africanus]